MVFGNDNNRMLNLELNEDVLQIIGKPNNFHVGNIKIVKKFTKKFNEADNSYKKITIQTIIHVRQKEVKISIKETQEIIPISV